MIVNTAKLIIAVIVYVTFSLSVQAQINIIPKPAHIEVGSGNFTIDEHTSIQYDPDNQQLATVASNKLNKNEC